MYAEIVGFLSTFLLISLASGCMKKKNEASKLKPRAMGDVPSSSQTSNKPATAAAGTPPVGDAAQSPAATVPKPAPPMEPRPADDNETINDAKSDWGVVP